MPDASATPLLAWTLSYLTRGYFTAVPPYDERLNSELKIKEYIFASQDAFIVWEA